MNYQAPGWLPGGHLQTIWPAVFARGEQVRYRRKRWFTPDADFIDVDFLGSAHKPDTPLLVLFHGLEGSSQSHYARAFAHYAQSQKWAYAVPHFRGCGGDVNLAPRAYHSGDFEEIDWILRRLKAQHPGPIIAVGISLGGNALMRWVAENGASANNVIRAAACICAPLDLAASGQALGLGFNRRVYTPRFLATMKPKALQRWDIHPGLFDRDKLRAARDLYTFDDVFTAPLHGFKDVNDYWQRASAKPHLSAVQLPSLVINALNDPFVPAASLPQASDVSSQVTLWQPTHGGHVGFAAGRFPGHVHSLPEVVGAWLRERLL